MPSNDNSKPVLFSDDVVRFDPRRRNSGDPSWIGGYSEIVQANDIDKADDLYFREQNNGRTKEDVYKQIGAKPRKLPVEFAWLPISGPAGGASPTQASEVRKYQRDQGFRRCSRAIFDRLSEEYGPFEFDDATWWEAEDGSIRRGYDVALFYRSGEVARNWEQYMAEEAAKAEGHTMPANLTEGGYEAPTFEEEERSKADIAH